MSENKMYDNIYALMRTIGLFFYS